ARPQDTTRASRDNVAYNPHNDAGPVVPTYRPATAYHQEAPGAASSVAVASPGTAACAALPRALSSLRGRSAQSRLRQTTLDGCISLAFPLLLDSMDASRERLE